MSGLRAAVFDLDGTLVDSLPLVLRSIAHAIEPFAAPSAKDIFAHLGGPPERFLPKLLGDARHLPEALGRMEAYHRENFHLIAPFDGTRTFLETLRARGVPAAIWTGRDRASTEPLLAAHDLGDFFSAIVCGDDHPTHKPDPAGLRALLRELGVAPAEAVYVGDADVDVEGGAAIGVDTILIRHGRAVSADVSAKAWRTVASPDGAFELVLARVA